jgi:hypothetical protein
MGRDRRSGQPQARPSIRRNTCGHSLCSSVGSAPARRRTNDAASVVNRLSLTLDACSRPGAATAGWMLCGDVQFIPGAFAFNVGADEGQRCIDMALPHRNHQSWSRFDLGGSCTLSQGWAFQRQGG